MGKRAADERRDNAKSLVNDVLKDPASSPAARELARRVEWLHTYGEPFYTTVLRLIGG